MVRKNISIGVDTWNDLAKLGKFGQTFDDIIKLLLKEREECIQNHRRDRRIPFAGGTIAAEGYADKYRREHPNKTEVSKEIRSTKKS